MAHREFPIPNRWLYCPRKSESIIAERFLAFKTPLSMAYKDQMPLDCIFTPEMIFGYIKTLKLKLGLWIDLTNTKRFYDRAVVDANGAKYIKMQCRGHGETPSAEQTRAFIEIVDSFIEERPLDIIAVHCTHGFNRTGFLIASYIVERLDCSVGAALAMFAKARPPGIYKQDYIRELFRRYEDEEDATPAPELPGWCLDYDDSNAGCSTSTSMGRKRKYNESFISAGHGDFTENGDDGDENDVCDDEKDESGVADADGSPHKSNGNKTNKRRRRELIIKNATFMEGVPGVTLVTDQPRLGELQQKVQQMCGWSKNGFPGAQPVSMDRENIKRLHEIPYVVSWKADGTRYMMLILKKDEIFFFDRNNSCFQVENLTFVKPGNLNEHLEDTLLDGEMVLDKFQGATIPRYLIYDVIKYCNVDIGKQPFWQNRLACISNDIIKPRHKAIQQGIINRQIEPFSVRNKDFWHISKAETLLGEKFAKSLQHNPDGLIFQPSKAPYIPGPCPDVLKWKPSDMNSVDFRLKIGKESGQGILERKVGLLYVGGFEGPIGQIKYTKDLRELDNKIIECTFNGQHQWEFMRERTDKVMPNSYGTAKAVFESIRFPITKDILLDYIEKNGYRDTRELMPPPKFANPRPSHPNNHNQHQQQLNQPVETPHNQFHQSSEEQN